jgi:cbb3-type cytochrome oxidase maturation protein
MNIIYILIPLGLILLLLAVAAFFWAVRSGQFDDLESPAWRVVLDDDRAPPAADTPETRPEQASQDNSPPG